MVYVTASINADNDDLVLTDFANNSCSLSLKAIEELIDIKKVCVLGWNLNANKSDSFDTVRKQLLSHRVDWFLHGAQSLKALGLCGNKKDTSRLRVSQREILVRALVRLINNADKDGDFLAFDKAGKSLEDGSHNGYRLFAYCPVGISGNTIERLVWEAANRGGLEDLTYMKFYGLIGRLRITIIISLYELTNNFEYKLLECMSKGEKEYSKNPYDVIHTVNWFANQEFVDFALSNSEDEDSFIDITKDEAVEYWINYLLKKFNLEIKARDDLEQAQCH